MTAGRRGAQFGCDIPATAVDVCWAVVFGGSKCLCRKFTVVVSCLPRGMTCACEDLIATLTLLEVVYGIASA